MSWRALAATALLVWSSGSALADPLIVPRATDLPGVTSVTDDKKVTVTMGIQMTPTNELGDSVRWWERRQAGWKRWTAAKKLFPRVKSKMIEMYLAALADGFSRTLPIQAPRTRFHFYVADTLNPSLWPAGGGFFVIHAGLLSHIKDERQFAFLMALEMAHEVLGHNFHNVRAGDVKWEPGRWRDGDFDGWPIEFWGHLVGRDPIDRGGFAYTVQQESDALELVYRFFKANYWEYDRINRFLADLLPALNAIPGASSLPAMHPNLKTAILLPHERPNARFTPADTIVNRSSYARMVGDVRASTLQHYPWMLELIPYRDLVLQRGLNLERIRREYDEHADIHTFKFDSARKKPRRQSLGGDLGDFDDLNEIFEERDQLPAAKLARLYLKGTILLGHRRYAEAIANAEVALKVDPISEPFLWQRALARQQQGKFNRCISEMSAGWRFFDHRRQLLTIECTFLEGRYTEAAQFAHGYRIKYPFDIGGAFWQTLTALRLRRPIDHNLREIEAFWGDRPLVRALQVFHYAYLGRFTEAKAALELKSEIVYPPQEWGVLEFAQSWMRETFNELHTDDRAQKLRKLAELEWPLARLVKYNLPRDAVQER